MMQGFAYFPSLVYRDEKPEWVDYLLKVTKKHYEWIEQNRPDDQKSWPMLQTAQMAGDPELKFLVDYLVAASSDILRDQGYAVDKYDFHLSGLWGQDIQCHGVTNMHVHKNSQMSGWIFLETPEGGSYPIYQDTRINKTMVELDYDQGPDVTNATNAIHFNNVVPGSVIFANSWMPHQMTTSRADSKTKTIHFIVSHKDKEQQCCTS